MSKKRSPHKKPPKQRSRLWLTKKVVAAIAICAIATGAVVSRLEPVRRTLGLSTTPAPAQAPGNLNLAKEYIYAGGRLIATEEPVASSTPSPTPSASPPTNLIAVVQETPSIGINLTWAAPPVSAATVSHYVIERAGRSGVTTLISNSDVPAFTDTTTQVDNVYRYRVQAVFSGGATSGFSNGDLAATFFQSDPVSPGQTVIKAKHLTDLRQAVNDVRLIAGWAQASWSTPAPAIGGYMSGNHIAELRANLEPALAELGVTSTTYTDATPLDGKLIRASHINELRARVR
jgi:hypothetical protein